MRKTRVLALMSAATVLLTACASAPPTGPMSFFVTSTGSGKGADLGGLAEADALCQKLATDAGSGGKTWRAYLSVPPTFPSGAKPAVPSINARDRVGSGPWFNAKGELIARDVAHLHNGNNISKTAALGERGNVVKGRGNTPNAHDLLTGSRADGTPSRRRPTPLAAHGPGAARVPRWSATMTASGRCPRTGPSPGTSRTSRPVAARRRWCGPAGPGGSTASRPTELVGTAGDRARVIGLRASVPGTGCAQCSGGRRA